MPGMSGDQVASEVKKAKPGTPVIMLTGFGDVMRIQGENVPCVDMIIGKPVTREILRSPINKVIS